jgi:hypothetical protein
MPALLDLTGEKYNRLTVLRRADKGACGKTRWLCRCDCGNQLEVFTMHLRAEHTKSCGCIPRQNSDRVMAADGKMVRPPGYGSWKAMISRCYNKCEPRYADYGGRGITVCDRWRGRGGLANFLADMGPKPSPKHSVGRQKSDKGYEPSNCRWETHLEQGRNKRNANLLTHKGKTLHIAAWDRELGLHTGGVRLRLSRGWTVHEALSTPRRFRAPAAPDKTEATGCANQEAEASEWNLTA